MKLLVKRLSSQATLPAQMKEGDAGFDLACLEDFSLKPQERMLISTGLAIALPTGFVGIIKDRSGMAFKHGLTVQAGVIDSNYRGEIKVLVHNKNTETISFSAGERIAQLLIIRHESPVIEEVSSLDQTVRGTQGFGSSDK